MKENLSPMIEPITSRYRIVENGGGGIGVVCKAVYKAEDTQLHRFVELKFPPQELSKEPQALARFQCEPLATSAWLHPNMNRGRGGGAWV